MWRFHILRSCGISRCLLLVLSALVCCFASFDSVQAQQQCYLYVGSGGQTFATAEEAGQSELPQGSCNVNVFPQICTSGYVIDSCTSTTTEWSCTGHHTQNANPSSQCSNYYCGTVNGDAYQGAVSAQTCPPNPCTSKSGKSVDTNVTGGSAAAGQTVYDAQGCAMQLSTNPVNVIGCGGQCQVATATYTGAQDVSGTPSAGSGSDCMSSGGSTFCSEDQNGKNCGTINGDEVCPASIPPGTCVSYASGGVACTMAPGANTASSPPAPNDGTTGTPATPTAQVSAPGSGSNSSSEITTDYYSSSSVAGSSTAVSSSSTGVNVGNGGSGSGSMGSGSGGSAPNAADGDCGATGVSCSGSVPPSGWSGDCSDWDTCFQTFYSAVGQAPIVQGAVAIETAWPAGSCDIGGVTLSTFDNRSFDYGATACQVWNDYIATPLSVILLACWAVVGIFIVLSA